MSPHAALLPVLVVLLAGTAAGQSFVDNTADIPAGAPHNASFTENVDFGDIDGDGDLDAIFADGGDNGNDRNRLWLNKGNWDGNQLVSREYVEASVRPPFLEANSAYGYLWWLNSEKGIWRTPYGDTGEGRIIPDAPANIYYAAGANSQLIFVVPDHNMVVVTMGNTRRRGGANPTAAVWAAIRSFLSED